MKAVLAGLLGAGIIASLLTAPAAHAQCYSTMCDQKFLSAISQSSIHAQDGGSPGEMIPWAHQVCDKYEAQWDSVTTPQIYQNVLNWLLANSPGLNNTNGAAFIGISQEAYCPQTMKG